MSPEKLGLFQSKLQHIKAELGKANLLIVSKNRPLEDILLYYELGHRDFGENRVQELQEKSLALQALCPEIRWHMIGHLQSNKINQLFAVPNLTCIHSVHDLPLLEKLLKQEPRLKQEELGIFLQMNTSGEQEKSGLENFSALEDAAQLAQKATKLKLLGLMTMGPIRTENFVQDTERCFQELKSYKQQLEAKLGRSLLTSMGMSQDYRLAVKAGTDWVRLGTTMFEA